MKLLYSFVFLLLINYINCEDLSVYTKFRNIDSECTSNNNFTVDTCANFCGTTSFVKVIYNFDTNEYQISLYSDEDCSTRNNGPITFQCPSDENEEIECSELVKIEPFNRFALFGSTIYGSCGDNGTLYELDSCQTWCANPNYYSKIEIVPGNVDGYIFNAYDSGDSSCTQKIENQNFMCLSNNAKTKMGSFELICSYVEPSSSNSSSSSNSTSSNSTSSGSLSSSSSSNSTDQSNSSLDGSSTSSSSIIKFSLCFIISVLLINILF